MSNRSERILAAARAAGRAATALAGARLRTVPGWVSGHYYVVNLDNNSGDHRVRRSLESMASTAPLFILVHECIGNTMPKLPGYRLVWDRSTRSRRNVAMYVSTDYKGRGRRLVDMTRTWARRRWRGRHEPRSILSSWLDRVALTSAHAPVRHRDGRPAQREHHAALVRIVSPDHRDGVADQRPRVVGCDFNARVGEAEPGADDLAEETGGQWAGRRILASVVRGQVVVHDHEYLTHVNGVAFHGDHGHVLAVEVSVPRVWLRPRRLILARRRARKRARLVAQ